MKDQTKIQLREEFVEDFGTYFAVHPEAAEWWLSKIDSLLQSQRDELVEKIREATGVMRTSETDKIINLINQNN